MIADKHQHPIRGGISQSHLRYYCHEQEARKRGGDAGRKSGKEN